MCEIELEGIVIIKKSNKKIYCFFYILFTVSLTSYFRYIINPLISSNYAMCNELYREHVSDNNFITQTILRRSIIFIVFNCAKIENFQLIAILWWLDFYAVMRFAYVVCHPLSFCSLKFFVLRRLLQVAMALAKSHSCNHIKLQNVARSDVSRVCMCTYLH